ncbi:MAG: histone deacetylase [Bryobacteraceae bacterium]|nr:histone deacetylase [Bryobacteraceae bacterium]
MNPAGSRPRLFYCDHHELPLPRGHRFPTRKYRLLRELLESDGWYELTPAPAAARAALELVHEPAYVASVLDGSVEPAVMRRIGFPWSPALVRRTLASVGGTLMAVTDAMAAGFGGNLAGGTHHAFRETGAGFCVFNDIAIAAAWLRKRGALRRAAVVDLDVHQGDGTARIFEAEPEVFTLSIHGGNNFPFRKRESRLDVSLPDGTSDEPYLDALSAVLPPVFDFGPQIVFYQSGVDVLAADTLGRLALTLEGLKQRDRMVMEQCRYRRIPLAITLGGGYADPIELTAQAHANTFRVAREVFS